MPNVASGGGGGGSLVSGGAGGSMAGGVACSVEGAGSGGAQSALSLQSGSSQSTRPLPLLSTPSLHDVSVVGMGGDSGVCGSSVAGGASGVGAAGGAPCAFAMTENAHTVRQAEARRVTRVMFMAVLSSEPAGLATMESGFWRRGRLAR